MTLGFYEVRVEGKGLGESDIIVLRHQMNGFTEPKPAGVGIRDKARSPVSRKKPEYRDGQVQTAELLIMVRERAQSDERELSEPS